ncbi:putative 2-oxoglutarate/Fe(II)-dependent dioxygenase [Platanthera zijinensis]|uniref:2-oxoglutarate/Fe(II)-dependent dioxygenase n=1 Tax=Platanthera zijinensis TaxID=2320716 RepID=A0AAP0G721_9ASPA
MVTEIADSGAAGTYFPSDYIAGDPSAVVTDDSCALGDIPIIDFSFLSNGIPETRAEIVRELGQACEEWGFFTVVNHGVTEEMRAAMMDAFVGFFDLAAEEKDEYLGRRVMDPIRMGTSFNSTVEDAPYWRHFLKIWVHPLFHSPTKPTVFREVSEDYAKHTRYLAKELLKGILDSLGLGEKEMEEALDLDSCSQVLVGNIYPPCPNPELTWGIPSHSDPGLLTVLMQNETDGLQVMHHGKWVCVNALPNSFLVNLGDHMEIVSNGRYKSVLHRAKVDNQNTRISIVTAIGPSLDTVVVPAPSLLQRGNHPAAFRGIKYGDFVEHQQSSRLKEKSVLDHLRV